MKDSNFVQPNQSFTSVGMTTELERATFIRKTYLHLALAVLGFIAVEAVFLNIPFIVEAGLAMTKGWRWLLMLGGFMLVTRFAENWAMSTTSKSTQYGGLVLYIIAEAFIFVPLLFIAMYYSGDEAIFTKAGLMTLALFTGLTAVVFFTGKDFSFLKTILTVGFIVALGAIVVGVIFGFDLGLFFSAAMVALAAGSILYQTSNILHKYNTDQYVAASLGLFASLMLLFWYILSIFMRD